MNDAGTIVGGIEGGAAVWQTENDLPVLLAGGGIATDINDLGQIVGTTFDNVGDDCHAVLWPTSSSSPIDLGSLGGGHSYAMGINNSGQVVGHSRTAAGDDHAFLWDPATHQMTDLGTLGGLLAVANAINDLGDIVGASRKADGTSAAALWSGPGHQISELLVPGGTQLQAYFVNNAREAVGSCRTISFFVTTCRWNLATAQESDLGIFDGGISPGGVNDLGWIAGWIGEQLDVPARAYVWTEATGVVELGACSNCTESFAAGINNSGTVVGKMIVGALGPVVPTVWHMTLVPATVAEAIQAISDCLSALVSAGALRSNEVPPLLAKLDAATRQMNAGNARAAINILKAFIHQVEALVKSGRLSAVDGQKLIALAEAAINFLAASP